MLIRKDTNIRMPTQKIHHPIIHFLFQNQYQIIYTPKHLFIVSLIFTFIFLALAAVTFAFVNSVKTIQLQYAQNLKCLDSNHISERCSIKFNLEYDMQSPIYFLYVVKNIYVNHRKFITSYNIDQLKGKVLSFQQARSSCSPFVLNKNINKKYSWGNTTLAQNEITSPCGMKAQGYFNDTYKLYSNGSQISINRNNIYKGNIFNYRRSVNSQNTQWVDVESQNFKLYMLDSSLMTRKKVWGIIENDLKAGSYQLIINNNFQMVDQDLQKGVILSTSTVMGGKSYFYPIAFAFSAILCFVLAIISTIFFSRYQELFQFYMKQQQ